MKKVLFDLLIIHKYHLEVLAYYFYFTSIHSFIIICFNKSNDSRIIKHYDFNWGGASERLQMLC